MIIITNRRNLPTLNEPFLPTDLRENTKKDYFLINYSSMKIGKSQGVITNFYLGFVTL